jgi:hypothetical protein
MYYHHRYLDNGNCEIICIRCFLTVGTASGLLAAKELESAHICPTRPSMNGHLCESSQEVIEQKSSRLTSYSSKLSSLPVPLLPAAVPLLLYALPTAIELALSAEIGLWLAGIVVGDFAACACLVAIFGMRKTGVILYLLLTISKICLFNARLLPVSILPWITDAIPVLFVIGKIASSRVRAEARPVPRT